MDEEFKTEGRAYVSTTHVGAHVQRMLDEIIPFEGMEGGYKPVTRIEVVRATHGWHVHCYHQAQYSPSATK